ncbi:MAG TPA: peptidase C45, partial [Bryobacteraceae bacterium]
MRYRGLLSGLLFGFLSFNLLVGPATASQASRAAESRMAGAFRKAPESGWILVHLQGGPSAVGFQHGYLLAPEIEDAKRAIVLSATHEVHHDWNELRSVAAGVFEPRIPEEYRTELRGMDE